MRARFWPALPALLVVFAGAAAADEKSGVNDEGFVQKWLVLASIPLPDGMGGGEAVDKEQVKDEARLKPKAGDKVKVGDKELTWKEHACKDHLLDFNGLLGAVTEDCVAYAVTYVVAPEEMAVKMKTGS